MFNDHLIVVHNDNIVVLCYTSRLYTECLLVLWVPPPEESPSLLEAEDLVEDGHRMGPRPLLPPLLLYAVIHK